MAEDSARLLFRLQHIIPQSVPNSQMKKDVSMFVTKHTPASSPDEPGEIEFQMSWGKIAGNPVHQVLELIMISLTILC